MPDSAEQNFIRIDNLDQRIYRIYTKDRFLKVLTHGKDALVNPGKWKDPFENFFLQRTKVTTGKSGEHASLETLARDWYGQCWTMNYDTDAMWRIYSPCSIGIQVRTTVRKLYGNLVRCAPVDPNLQCFVGGVDYMTVSQIEALMGSLTFSHVAISGSVAFANLLCIKREAFKHEAEIRLLFQDLDSQRHGADGLFLYDLNVNDVFEEVVLDPRLEDATAAALKKELHQAGCSLPMNRSDLYKVPQFTIPFEHEHE